MALRNPFAQAPSGTLIHVDQYDAESGPFTCPGCSSSLRFVSASREYRRRDSRRPISKRAHFRHVEADETPACFETALHMWAKLIIEEAMTVGLPSKVITFSDQDGSMDPPPTYDAVLLEPWQDGIRPDIVMRRTDGSFLNVEIRVHHRVGPEKIAHLKAIRRSCVEIDLSGFDFDHDPGHALRHAILRKAPRTWLHNEAATRADTVASDRSLLAQEAAQLLAAIHRHPNNLSDDERRSCESEIELYATDPFIGLDGTGAHWFDVEPRFWQHMMLRRYLISSIIARQGGGEVAYCTPPPAIQIQGFPHERTIHGARPEVLAAAGIAPAEFSSPNLAVAHYFAELCRGRVRDRFQQGRRIAGIGSAPGLMRMNPSWVAFVERIEDLFIDYLDAGQRTNRTRADFLVWAHTPMFSGGRTPADLGRAGGTDHFRLRSHLAAIVNMLNGGWPVTNLLGIEEAAFRDRRRSRIADSDDDCGYRPADPEAWCICPSARLLRQGWDGPRILSTMAMEAFRSSDEAEAFLSKPLEVLGGCAPIEFAIDVPTAQTCIALLHPATGRIPARLW